jgi:plasmid stability protein
VAQLVVRNLDEELVRRLKKRAGEHGVSMEEEHRKILREVLYAEEISNAFWQHLTDMPDVGDESLFERDKSHTGRATEQKLFEE